MPHSVQAIGSKPLVSLAMGPRPARNVTGHSRHVEGACVSVRISGMPDCVLPDQQPRPTWDMAARAAAIPADPCSDPVPPYRFACAQSTNIACGERPDLTHTFGWNVQKDLQPRFTAIVRRDRGVILCQSATAPSARGGGTFRPDCR